MTKLRIIILVLVVLPSSIGGQIEPVEIKTGFMTGQQFRDLPEVRRRSYAAGTIDDCSWHRSSVHRM